MRIIETSRVKMPRNDSYEYFKINGKFDFNNGPLVKNQNDLKEYLEIKYSDRKIKDDKTILYDDDTFYLELLK